MKIFTSSIFLSLSIILFSQENNFNCFSILVGKDATIDGSVMLAHNEDDYGERVVNMIKADAKVDVDPFIEMNNGGVLKINDWQNAYLWLEMPEMEFSDAYMNEFGVTIASDACQSREDEPILYDGGIGYWLRRTLALNATSSREAVKMGGTLVETFGYASSGRTYVIADAQEAWMLSVVNGIHWVAQRVPDDEVAIIPNYYTIGEIDLSDTLNFYGSEDLIDYAIDRGWYDPAKDGEFSFRKAYSDEENLINPVNVDRHWRSINLLSEVQFDHGIEYPFSFKPESLIHITDLYAILRDHYEGTDLDLSDEYKKGNPHSTHRGICCSSSQYGFVAHLRSGLPPELGNMMWLSMYRPCVHPFLPVYFGMYNFPENFTKYSESDLLSKHFDKIEDISSYDENLFYFDFYHHALKIDENYGTLLPAIQYENYMIEAALIEEQKNFEESMSALLEENREKAIEELTDFVHQQFEDYQKQIRK